MSDSEAWEAWVLHPADVCPRGLQGEYRHPGIMCPRSHLGYDSILTEPYGDGVRRAPVSEQVQCEAQE